MTDSLRSSLAVGIFSGTHNASCTLISGGWGRYRRRTNGGESSTVLPGVASGRPWLLYDNWFLDATTKLGFSKIFFILLQDAALHSKDFGFPVDVVGSYTLIYKCVDIRSRALRFSSHAND
jgi:hypothetical protein